MIVDLQVWSPQRITSLLLCNLRCLLDFFENMCTPDMGRYLGTTVCQYIN